MMIVTIPLLSIHLVFGSHINNASRWINIPLVGLKLPDIGFGQAGFDHLPGAHLSRKQENIKDVKESFLPIMGSVCLVFIFIALANLSTALMLFGVSILLLIIGRISIKQIAVVCGAGFILLMGVIFLGPRTHTYASRKHVPASRFNQNR
jgi:cell division protein FtsW